MKSAKKTKPGTARSRKATADSVLVLDAGLEIKDVALVRARMLDALQGVHSLTIDMSQVAAMDSAGAQLLLGLQNETRKRGVALTYRGLSNPVTRALTALGLSDKVGHAA